MDSDSDFFEAFYDGQKFRLCAVTNFSQSTQLYLTRAFRTCWGSLTSLFFVPVLADQAQNSSPKRRWYNDSSDSKNDCSFW